MGSISDNVTPSVPTLVGVGLVGGVIIFTLRAWVIMLALGVINVNASWRQTFLATFLLSLVFGSSTTKGPNYA